MVAATILRQQPRFYLLSDGGRYVRTACLTLPQAWKNVIPEKPIMYAVRQRFGWASRMALFQRFEAMLIIGLD